MPTWAGLLGPHSCQPEWNNVFHMKGTGWSLEPDDTAWRSAARSLGRGPSKPYLAGASDTSSTDLWHCSNQGMYPIGHRAHRRTQVRRAGGDADMGPNFDRPLCLAPSAAEAECSEEPPNAEPRELVRHHPTSPPPTTSCSLKKIVVNSTIARTCYNTCTLHGAVR